MINLELVNKISESAKNIMKSEKILASYITAAGIEVLNKESEKDLNTLVEYNNIFKITTKDINNSFILEANKNRGKRFIKYENIEECIIDWINTLKNIDKFKELWDFESFVSLSHKLYNNTQMNKNNIRKYYEAYSLDKVDKEVLDEIIDKSKNIIDIPEEEVKDIVKQCDLTPDTIQPEQEQIKEETATINKNIVTINKTKNKIKTYNKGDKYIVNSVNLYDKLNSTIASRSYTGPVYIYATRCINHRYPVVFKKETLNATSEYIDGYINKKDLN